MRSVEWINPYPTFFVYIHQYAIIETASIFICDYFIKSKILAAKRIACSTVV